MERREETAFVPKDSFERVVASAISTGKLQHLLLDNRTLWTHDMLRRLLGVILASKPARRLLSQRQIRSRFLEMIIRTQRFALVDRVVNNGKKPDYSHPELAREPPTS